MTPDRDTSGRSPVRTTPTGASDPELAGAQQGWADALARLADSERETAEVRSRLEEVDETIRALRQGEVDALVVDSDDPGQRVFTLSSADRPYRMFVENMNDGAATVSDLGVVLYVNPRLATMLRCSIPDLVGSHITAIVVDNEAARSMIAGGYAGTTEVELIALDGTRVPVLQGMARLEVDGEQLTCLTFTDLTAQKLQDEVIGRLNRAQREQLRDLHVARNALVAETTHDSLTGLPNRTLFADRVEQALALGHRTGHWTAVLFVDLDRFKYINESWGHGAGDAILREVGERLLRVTRPMDTVARAGADEFVVLAPDISDQLEAVDIASRLAAALRPGFSSHGAVGTITASIGISVTDDRVSTAELLLDEAETAMYHAKSLGRDRAEVFDGALRRRAQERAATEKSLQQALDDRRLTPFYQPIIDLDSGRVAGFEALARIRAVTGEILTPDKFIAVAEESGLIVPLGEEMMRASCEEAHRWQAGRQVDLPAPTVAVNLSPLQLDRPDLTGQVRRILAEADVTPAQLHLEITETALMELRPEVLIELGRVRELGVEIGLDDFGTGYASLTHLRRLPVTFIKVARSFISGLGEDVEDERIVAAVIDLAAGLGLRSIAEGIETPLQLDLLRNFGCDQAQGYLFARPSPHAEFDRMYPVLGAGYPATAGT